MAFGQVQTLGRYQLTRMLGAGGFAAVYLAQDAVLERPVALKVLHPHLAIDADVRARFIREGRALARVQHPNVVHLYDAGEIEGTAYLAMELVVGDSIADHLGRRGAFAPAETAALVDQIGAGLAAIHAANLVHRDVKPANVLIEEQTGRAVLLDLGVARIMDASRITATGLITGTPGYMAPEQIDRDGEATIQTDTYALAAVAYSMLTGRPPFEGDTARVLMAVLRDAPVDPRQYRTEVPMAVVSVVQQGMAKDPRSRPAGPVAFAHAFRAAAGQGWGGEEPTLRMPPGMALSGHAGGPQSPWPTQQLSQPSFRQTPPPSLPPQGSPSGAPGHGRTPPPFTPPPAAPTDTLRPAPVPAQQNLLAQTMLHPAVQPPGAGPAPSASDYAPTNAVPTPWRTLAFDAALGTPNAHSGGPADAVTRPSLRSPAATDGRGQPMATAPAKFLDGTAAAQTVNIPAKPAGAGGLSRPLLAGIAAVLVLASVAAFLVLRPRGGEADPDILARQPTVAADVATVSVAATIAATAPPTATPTMVALKVSGLKVCESVFSPCDTPEFAVRSDFVLCAAIDGRVDPRPFVAVTAGDQAPVSRDDASVVARSELFDASASGSCANIQAVAATPAPGMYTAWLMSGGTVLERAAFKLTEPAAAPVTEPVSGAATPTPTSATSPQAPAPVRTQAPAPAATAAPPPPAPVRTTAPAPVVPVATAVAPAPVRTTAPQPVATQPPPVVTQAPAPPAPVRTPVPQPIVTQAPLPPVATAAPPPPAPPTAVATARPIAVATAEPPPPAAPTARPAAVGTTAP